MKRQQNQHNAIARRIRAVTVAIVATVFVVSCEWPDTRTMTTELVVNGLSLPLFVTAPPEDVSRIFVVQQRGAIEVVNLVSGNKGDAPFLDLTSVVTTADHQGMLGLAFHPSYSTNGYLYVSYTDLLGDLIVERFSVSEDINVADSNSGAVVITVPMTDPRHNGGMIAFGPDGYLYIGVADDFDTSESQDRTNLLGTILRIDVDGPSPYGIPSDNPYADNSNGYREEIWAYGLRNSWRFSFDRISGDLWISDTGEQSREEINFQAAGVGAGRNYGWDVAEGLSCRGGTGTCGTNSGFTPPIYDYAHDADVGWVIIGGYVYQGAAIPAVTGRYFYADFRSKRIWTVRRHGDIVTDPADRTSELDPGNGLEISNITSFGEDAEGEIYLVDYGDGEVFRIIPR